MCQRWMQPIGCPTIPTSTFYTCYTPLQLRESIILIEYNLIWSNTILLNRTQSYWIEYNFIESNTIVSTVHATTRTESSPESSLSLHFREVSARLGTFYLPVLVIIIETSQTGMLMKQFWTYRSGRIKWKLVFDFPFGKFSWKFK